MDKGDDGSVGAPPHSAMPSSRIIIALDLDAFYVAASRKRDPSLNGLPIGIKQKHILATVSYEARARGVKKLALIRDAMRQCPEMILVNGENLSYFRKVSQEIFHLVSSMVEGGLVEKLGMDELFCDVTDMVEKMYVAAHTSTDFPPPFGVVLPDHTQHTLQQNGNRIHSFDPVTQRLLLATHLAHQIRERVSHEAGLTCSAGIATSKYLAKLVGNVNKPNRQTVFAPLQPGSAQHDVQHFLDPFPVRALNGFGSAITAKMCETAVETMGMPSSAASNERMTVLVARQIFDLAALQRLFGVRLAERLHGLLHGIDDDPVVRAPDFPAQISIEDTYQGLPFHDAAEQFYILGQSLLRRLETELIARPKAHANPLTSSDEDAFSMVELPFDCNGDQVESIAKAALRVRDYKETSAAVIAPRSSTWLRYPMSMRLSVRQGYTNRVTRQTRMPVEVFNLTLPRAERAGVLARSCQALFRAILAVEGDRGEGLNLINIAALDLQIRRPAAQSIGRFFHSAAPPAISNIESDAVVLDDNVSQNETSSAPSVDMQFLLELPADIRAEVAAEYGITLAGSAIEDAALSLPPPTQRPSSSSNKTKEPQTVQFSSQASSKTDTSTSSGATTYICSHCGQHMSPYLQHDHQRWPLSGLPPSDPYSTRNDVMWDNDGNHDDDDVLYSSDYHQHDSE